MSDCDTDVRSPEAELARAGQAFRGLTESGWCRPLLQPLAR